MFLIVVFIISYFIHKHIWRVIEHFVDSPELIFTIDFVLFNSSIRIPLIALITDL